MLNQKRTGGENYHSTKTCRSCKVENAVKKDEKFCLSCGALFTNKRLRK